MKEEQEEEQEGFATRDEERVAFPDLSDFEFFVVIFHNTWKKLRLPDKYAELLDGQEPRAVKLREASGGRRLWDVAVWFDGEGQMYLERGWEQFARAHDLELGNVLVFSYDGDAVLTVKVFDGTTCRRHYKQDDADTGSESSGDGDTMNSIDDSVSNSISDRGRNSSSTAAMEIDDVPTSRFTVTLRPSHLGARQKQYLNVPPEFQKAHGYDNRSEVVLQMRGKKWTVKLKHNVLAGGRTRAGLRYGWHQFVVDNGLVVGDVCFFQVLRLRGDDAGGGEDQGRAQGENYPVSTSISQKFLTKTWGVTHYAAYEKYKGNDLAPGVLGTLVVQRRSAPGEDHVLKVEVRKRDGTFLD